MTLFYRKIDLIKDLSERIFRIRNLKIKMGMIVEKIAQGQRQNLGRGNPPQKRVRIE
jgi:hypothetical protein